jgi:hypothetical protein
MNQECQNLQYKKKGLSGFGMESFHRLHHETTIMLQKPRTSHLQNNEPLQQLIKRHETKKPFLVFSLIQVVMAS